MSIKDFFHDYTEVINGISNIFMAIGTVGAVIVALALSYNNNKPKLKIFAYVGVVLPEMTKHLWISCINTGKQAVICNNFAFAPRLSKPERLMPIKKLEISINTPKIINFSERIDQYFCDDFFSHSDVSSFLGSCKWLARIKLKLFWRVVVHTNIGEFSGKLSNELINRIISLNFTSIDQ